MNSQQRSRSRSPVSARGANGSRSRARSAPARMISNTRSTASSSRPPRPRPSPSLRYAALDVFLQRAAMEPPGDRRGAMFAHALALTEISRNWSAHPARNHILSVRKRATKDLVDSFKNRDINGMKKAIADGADPNGKDFRGNTLLFYLDLIGFDLDLVGLSDAGQILDLLLKAGANIDAVGEEGQTPIFQTSEPGIVDLLAQAGANVNKPDHRGETPIFWFLHDEAALGSLIRANAEMNFRDKRGKTILHHSATGHPVGVGRYVRCMVLALRHGANPAIRDYDGNSPLHALANMTRAEFMNDNSWGEYEGEDEDDVLAGYYQKTKAAFLILYGAEVHARNNAGKTPLDLVRDNAVREALVASPAELREFVRQHYDVDVISPVNLID